MVKSNRENEIKLAFPDPDTATKRLLKAGALLRHPRAFEDNVLFDGADRALTKSGRIIRLRQYGGRSVLTFKGPITGDHRHKVRVEHETAIDDADALRAILAGVGLTAVYRYQKYRTTYALSGVEAALDETPIGTFVELEGEPADVDRAADALGVRPEEFLRVTYRDLQEQQAAERGLTAGDMLMPRDPKDAVA